MVLLCVACAPASSVQDNGGDPGALRRSAAGLQRDAPPPAGGGDPVPSPAPVDPARPEDPTTPTTTSVPAGGGAAGAPAPIRLAGDGTWVDTECEMMPADSYWHARADSMPRIEPTTPDGKGLRGFPGAAEPDDPLTLRPALRNTTSKTITWSDSDDPLAWVRVEGGWQRASEYSAVDTLTMGPFTWATAGLLRHRVPDEVLIELSSTDDHALFVDTDTCTLIEYIRWNRIPGLRSGQKATVNDLRTNERRLSVRDGWLSEPSNSPVGGSIDSPPMTTQAPLIDFEADLLERPRGSSGASGGSAIPSSPGMVRLEEVFATPVPGDQRVDPSVHIDHAIGVALPWQHVTGMPVTLGPSTPAPFSWPATTSDGCGGITCHDGRVGSQYHVPMGSRLRLGAERCNEHWSDPQAQRIVEAMCTYGIVVTDNSDHFSISTERSPQAETSKWSRTAESELATITLRDFELVDATASAAVDAQALWEEARNWAGRRFGFGSQLEAGWYDGGFWNSLLGCERGVGSECSDAGLARVDAAVNGSRWYAVR